MKKILIILTFLGMTLLNAMADNVTFTANAPEAVAVGDQFRLTYTVTTQNARNLEVPSIKGFDVLMGPNRSTQSSVSIVNGQTTSTSSITFTYILMANTEGTFTIPGASITADGQNMVSNSVTVKVLPADSSDAAQSSGSSASSNAGTVSANDLFITCTTSKTKVYEQEAILLTYKIYTNVDLRGFDNVKLPDFKGFQSQEVSLPNDRKWELEHYRGRNYRTTIYRQFVLFPQQTGQIAIEPARFDASIAKAMQVDDPFEAFFNGGARYAEIRKTITTPRIQVTVDPLPAGKPADYSGGVGSFTLSSDISSTNVRTNDAITLKLIISGTGNMKLISTPEVSFPADFEVYDPKTDNQLRLTNDGLSGNITIEYLAIPRNAGDFRIPAVSLSYFDIKSRTYRTLTTPDYNIHVEKGEGNATQTIANYNNKEDLKVLNEDIHFIRQNDVELHPRGSHFFGTTVWWLCYIIPLLLAVVTFMLCRRYIAESANVSKVRTRKANKVAQKRMKQAGRLLAAGDSERFYDEMLKALWGYAGDKLSMPVSQLSKDNIEEKLSQVGVEPELVQTFTGVLNDCEFARFAPGDPGQNMDRLYKAAIDIIGKMESSISKTHHINK